MDMVKVKRKEARFHMKMAVFQFSSVELLFGSCGQFVEYISILRVSPVTKIWLYFDFDAVGLS